MDTTLAEVFPVGEHLADELEARGWTQVEFAEILGRPTQFVSEIIQGKKQITRESAAQIGAALQTSAEFWLNLQDSYFLWKQRQVPGIQEELDEVKTRAKLNDLAPMAVLRKRGVITATSTAGQAQQLMHLMGIETLDAQPRWQLAARRNNDGEPLTPTQNGWFACVRKTASNLAARAYSRQQLEALAKQVSRLVRDPSGFKDLPERFAAVGVRLVFVEAFPSSKISGACYEDEAGPVIALSGRGQRLDKVLFTLLHEIAHVVQGDVSVSGKPLIDEDDHTLGDEDRADELASGWVFDRPLPKPPPRIGTQWVKTVAQDRGVHPIVVIGRLQRERLLPWRSALVANAPNATPYLKTWNPEVRLG
ncbi:HigA family addiction module antidote protein [Amycolatopsis rhizosphaerae]|uniref:HigA family addiction module antidote protein n=1 Tax=Amycolatopsis rhizosphaerae TaxID=2053003 RepID=A0A558AQB9_9PSEU|nr:HigA family addiction module antitoxin [Amycolatopsis rhizosphaerae]TVT26469.1 HigA family addiction module antidote protein [Amycolatopsis rhizosphaerae]